MGKKENLTAIELHSAGATIIHKTPFDHLESYENANEITQSFSDEWVVPFYFELYNSSDDWIIKMAGLIEKITDEIILKNLGDFNWRTRSTGAYFCTITGKSKFIDIIGTHLLKSEVCYAGSHYALALCSFNNKKSRYYLNTYLNYYLNQVDLEFDQSFIISVIKYLDELNDTNDLEKHKNAWHIFKKFRIDRMKKLIEDVKDENHKQKLIDRTEDYFKFWQSNVSSKYIHQRMDVISKIKTYRK